MNERPTPETDQFKVKLKTICGKKYWVPVEHSERLERERDEWAERWADLARTCIKDICAMERERDEAREALEEETKFHHRTHSELIQTQCKLMDVKQGIIATLEENRHLADGDDCTLAKLKSLVPEWK